MVSASRRYGAAFLACFTLPAVSAPPAAAQVVEVPEIVITPYYVPTPTGRVGSTVSVISREKIAKMSPASITQIFRSIPGVTVIESGGPGGSTEIRLRGAETGHTLVLIDGVRVNDFATARDDFDFALISPNDIERIEILRGPQSALYGSDAMGGVINIITRKPKRGVSASASVQGGSYGTHAERLSGGMSAGDFSARFSGSYFASDGFSRRGDRDDNEADGTEKWASSFSGVYEPLDGPKVEAGINAFDQFSEYDAISNPDAPYTVDRTAVSGFGRISTRPSSGGRFRQSLTGFFLDSSRDNLEPGGSLPVSRFDATAVGAEYQGVMDFSELGSLLVGGRLEHERASNVAETAAGFPGYESDRTFYAAYGLHQVTLADDLHLTFGGRYDGEIDGDGFLTGRATAAYQIPETGTTFRASAGTGAKRPTAYQIGNNFFAAAKYPDAGVETDLEPEKSLGVDAGIEQSLGGRVNVSSTVFYNRFKDLIVFTPISFPDGFYENIDRAETAGVEVAAEADIVPGRLRGGISYAYLYSRDLDTGRPLPRRPEHSAAFDLTFIASSRLDVTLSGILVGERFSTSSAMSPMPAYGRLDLSARYALNPHTELFARIENLTDAHYEDPTGYNAPGLSAYIGLNWAM